MKKKVFAFLFSYKGRIGRKSYLIFHAIAIPIIVILTYPFLSPNTLVLRQITVFIIAYCSIPISIKRCHDIDWNAWAYLGFTWCIPMFSQTFSFYTNVLITAIIVRIIGSIWLLGACVYLCSKRGTQGPNRYGEMPT